MNRSLAATCLAAPLAALAAPSAAHDIGGPFGRSHAAPAPTVSFGFEEQTEAYPGDSVDGYRIANYVFVYADLDNDGVLRGRELRRAKNRAIREDRGNRRFD